MLNRILRYLIATFLSLLFYIPCFAAAPIESDGTAAIAAGAQTVTLSGSYSHVIVWLSSGSSTVNLTFNQVTATTSNCLIGSGATIAYGMGQNTQAISQFGYYGNGTTGTINWMAW